MPSSPEEHAPESSGEHARRSPEEHARLLTFYRDRVDAYPEVDDEYGQRWRTWCRSLLAHGGSLVVPPLGPEADLEKLLTSGAPIDLPVRAVPGEPSKCHHNVAVLWLDGTVASIGTGYALSEDGLWRQHSWGLTAVGELVETTAERRAYVGVALPTRAPSMQFAGSNAQGHLMTVLRRRDARAVELAVMIRELAGVAAPQS